MKKSEKIADRKQQLENDLWEALTSQDLALTEGYAKEVLQAHTTATLDTLKERVEGLKFDEDYKGMEGSYIAGNNEALDEVIAVIDEVRNE